MNIETKPLPRQSVRAIVPSPAPSIESSRLLLRPVAKRDTPALFAIRAIPEVAKFNHPTTPFQSIAEAEEWLAGKIFSEGPTDIIGRSFNYSIVDKAIPDSQEQVIGYISINAVEPFPDIGYSLAPSAWGKGFATEALGLLLKAWWSLPRRSLEESGAQEEDIEKVWALSHKTNKGSFRVLEKCGFELEGDAIYDCYKLYLWSCKKPST